MLKFHYRARLNTTSPKGIDWAKEMASHFTRVTGHKVDVFMRVGGGNEVLFASEFPDFDTMVNTRAKMLSDQAAAKAADRGVAEEYLDPRSIDNAIWVAA